ncbi:LysR family transcriptional regulator [uncultured Xylophilus sp.]|uniref:LysR family transcriptional regulator n=1 Tax=uncultured Xylophilus sp. TaxID=296832 RepID=UPI0025E55A80|nr:LysR family transcriptional regulator [uncultured Xylophilus sp.]
MRLRHLEIFHAVMRSGSVSGAANVLHLSQSAASKALVQAEHALGLSLFKRAQGRLLPTKEAERLFSETTVLFAHAESVKRVARDLKRDPAEHLRIGCLPSLGLGLIPRAVATLHARHPTVSIDIATANGDELADQVVAQELDLAVCFEPPPKQGMEALFLGSVRTVHLSRAMPGGSLDTHPVQLESLPAEDWIGIGGSDPLAERIRDVYVSMQLPEPTPKVETRTYFIAAALAREGVGYTLVDEMTASVISHGMTIRQLEPTIEVGAFAIHRAGASHSAAFHNYVDMLRAQFAKGREHI